MMFRNSILVYAAILSLLVSMTLPVIMAQESYSVEVIINDEGVVKVVINGTAISGLNKYPAPVDPIISTMKATLNGGEVASIYVNKTIYIATTTNGTIQITYIGNITTTSKYLEFKINDIGRPVKIIVYPNIVLLNIPNNILSVKNIDGKLVMVVLPPATIKYTVTKPATTTTPGGGPGTTTPITTTSPRQTQSPTPTTTTTQQQQGPITPAPPIPTWTYAVVAAVIAAVIIGGLLYLRKTRAANIPDILDKTDKLILEQIKKAGGTIMQGELQRITGLPKATLWRRVKKLARLGFLEIVKEGNSNKLILKKKF
ncbi:MAG: winged helix-turn-helix transcriptional regulator [Crenarchaeota archaeon]|nr:winged helix-turn-helix transcriptional regulator [Thermoproteota archaeon]